MKSFAGLALAGVMTLTASMASADQPAAPTPAPAASNAAAPAPAATPLQTRPAKKLELSTMKDESTPVGYKLLAGAIVVAGAIVYVKKKKGGLTKDKAKKKSHIDLLARHSVGVRSEVLVVEVEGTRLLVGMTPGSMNTLAVLQTPEGVIGEESPLMGEEKYMDAADIARVERAERPSLRAMLDADEEEDEPAPVKVGPRKAQVQVSAEQEEVDELEGRVRSLLDARQGGKSRLANKKAPVTAPESSRALPARRPAPTATAHAPRVPGQAKGLLLSMQQDETITKLGDW